MSRVALWSFLVLLASFDVAAAQEYRGTILGRVLDQQGAVLPGAVVVVTNENTNVSDQAITESDGAYTIPFLIPGSYSARVELQGFKRYVQSGITVAIGQRVTVDVRLDLGELVETVVVTSEAPMLDTSSGALGQVIDRTRVEAMPL